MNTMEFSEQKVFDYIDAHKDEYVGLLQTYCRQPSLAGTGEGIEDMVKIVVSEFEKRGLRVQVCPTPGNPVIIAEYPGATDKLFGFYDHYDVQPVDPLNEWIDPPFSAVIRDGKIFARGAADNKGGIATKLCAVDAYQHVYGKLPCGVKFIVEGEEEIGSPNLEWFAAHYRDRLDCDGYNWEGGNRGENKGPIDMCLGVKGLLYVELTARNAKMDAHSCNASIVQNPCWRMIWALSSMKAPDGKILIDHFYDGIPPLKQEDIDVFKKDGFSEAGLKDYLGIDGFLNGMSGEELLKNYHYSPTCNICGFYSGYIGEGSKTVLPSYAKVKIDFRLVTGQDPDRILELLRAHLDSHGFGDIEVKKLSGDAAFRSDPDSDFCACVERAAERFTGQSVTLNYMNAGTSPVGVFCREKMIPAVMVGCGSERANIHAPNEFFAEEDYIDEIKLHVAMMHELSGNI